MAPADAAAAPAGAYRVVQEGSALGGSTRHQRELAQKKKNRLSPRSANFVRHTAALDDFWMSLSFASAPSRKSPSSTVDDRESVELVTPAAVPSTLRRVFFDDE